MVPVRAGTFPGGCREASEMASMVRAAKSTARPKAAVDLGELIKRRMRASAFTSQSELARAAGFSDSVVSALIKAERPIPRATVQVIARTIDPSEAWLAEVSTHWLAAKRAWGDGKALIERPGRELASGVRELLVAQQRAAHHLPYRLLIDNVPPLATLYVEQDSSEEVGRNSPGEMGLGPRPVQDVMHLHRNLLLTADAGGGKSTVQYHFTAESADWWLTPDARATLAPPCGWVVPVRVRATAIASSVLAEAVAETVHAELHEYLDVRIDQALFREPPGAGIRWLLLVDGLDEILDVDQRARVITALARRLEEPENAYRFLVASRPLGEVELGPLRMAGAVHYKLQPFTAKQLNTFAGSWFRARSGSGDPDRFIQSIEHARLNAVVTLPLLATIAAIVYEETGDGELPTSRAGLYREFFRYLLDVRQSYFQARRKLLENLSDYRHGGRLADWLFENISDLLESMAVSHILSRDDFGAETDRLWHQAVNWTVANAPHPVGDIPRWKEYVRSLLIGTGVVRLVGDALEFVHRSFAEYLAGGWMVSEWLGDGLTRLAIRRVIDQLGRESVRGSVFFALGRWLEEGGGIHEPAPLLHELIKSKGVELFGITASLRAAFSTRPDRSWINRRKSASPRYGSAGRAIAVKARTPPAQSRP